jgi:hypothetical protein
MFKSVVLVSKTLVRKSTSLEIEIFESRVTSINNR